MKKQNFMSDVKEAIQVALLKDKAMHNVASHKNKNTSAILILVLAALLGSIGMKFFGGVFSPSWGMVLGMSVHRIITTVVGIYVMSFVAKTIFKGTAKHDAFFRVAAFAMIVTWITVLPVLGFIAAIWGLVLIIMVLKTVHKVTTGGAIGTLIVSVLALGIIGMILAPVFASLGYQGLSYNAGTARLDNFKNGFEIDFSSEDGEGSMKMEDGKMVIEGPDGEKMEITLPNAN